MVQEIVRLAEKNRTGVGVAVAFQDKAHVGCLREAVVADKI